MADGAGDDVGGDRQREAEAQHAAENHQRKLEPVEPAPFQVALALNEQFVGDGHLRPRHPVASPCDSWEAADRARPAWFETPALAGSSP
jgi:hypothetical protein